MTARTFDWRPNPALQDAVGHHVSALLDAPEASGSVLWNIGITLDQGAEGECVGHGWAHCLAADPNPEAMVGIVVLQNPTAEHLYERAQYFDGSPPDEQSGASVGGGAKAAAELGGITAYHWATSIADIQRAVLNVGPVVLGIPWLEGMMEPDPNGVIHATGPIQGGHCILDRGYDPQTGMHTLHNSWGASWGNQGDALISDADLASLFAQQGEAAVPTKVAQPAPPTPVPPNPADPDHALAAVAHAWTAERHVGRNHLMAVALNNWLTAKGL